MISREELDELHEQVRLSNNARSKHQDATSRKMSATDALIAASRIKLESSRALLRQLEGVSETILIRADLTA